MNKTKIDQCDSTWNPVTGCLHGCEYCYARGIANRFSGGGEKWADGNLFVLDEKFYVEESEYDYADCMEVIGNIFDNPELLEVGE